MRCVGLCPVLLTATSSESSNIEILDQLHWSLNKEKDCLRDCMVEKGGGSFYRVVKARYLDCCER
jgi:hypothetical protein